jgi:uncharacterized membrane protein YfcA
MTELVETTALGFAAGMFAAMFGVGGGIPLVATLTLVLGLTQLSAQATSLAAMVPVAAVGAWRQGRYGNVHWRAAIVIGLCSAGGVAAGTAVASALPEHTLRQLFAILLLLIAARLVFAALRGGRSTAEKI